MTTLRTFFINREIDHRISRLAVDTGMSKNATMSLLVVAGATMFSGDLPTGLKTNELDEGRDESQVHRTVYIPAEVDEQIRTVAYEKQISKSALIRTFIDIALVGR